MKKLITTLLILTSFAASAQTYKYLTIPGETGYSRGATRVDGILWLGNDTLPVPVGVLRTLPALIGKGDSLYRWSPVQGKWIPISGGGASVWGSITGTLANQTDLQAALNNKQNKLLQGTTAQYFRGDLSLGTFSTDVLSITNNLYAPYLHTHNGLVPSGGASGYVLRKVSGTDFDMAWQPIETVSPVSSVFGRTGAVTADPADYSAFYPTIQQYNAQQDTLNAHKNKLYNIGVYATGGLIGKPSATVGDKDTISGQAFDDRITILEQRTDPDLTDFVTWTTFNYFRDSLQNAIDTTAQYTSINIDSVKITGTTSKILTNYYSNGTTYSAPFTDLTGGGSSDSTIYKTNGVLSDYRDVDINGKYLSFKTTSAATEKGMEAVFNYGGFEVHKTRISAWDNFSSDYSRFEVAPDYIDLYAEGLDENSVLQHTQISLEGRGMYLNSTSGKYQIYDLPPPPLGTPLQVIVYGQDAEYPDRQQLYKKAIDSLGADGNSYTTGHTLNLSGNTLSLTTTRNGLSDLTSNTITLPSGGSSYTFNNSSIVNTANNLQLGGNKDSATFVRPNVVFGSQDGTKGFYNTLRFNLTNPVNGQTLVLSNGVWINSTPSGTTDLSAYSTTAQANALYAPISHTHAQSSITALTDTITALRNRILYLEQNGAAATPTVATSSASGLTLSTTVSDYFFNGTTAVTWTLPSVSNTGKRYTISNIGTAGLTVSGTLFTNAAASSILLLQGDAYEFQSNGTTWKVK